MTYGFIAMLTLTIVTGVIREIFWVYLITLHITREWYRVRSITGMVLVMGDRSGCRRYSLTAERRWPVSR